MKLPTAREMRELDRRAIEDYGIAGGILMENAGLGTVLMMERELGPAAGSFALILVGPGNNGGDGLVIGRHLHQRGCEPVFLFVVPPQTLAGDAARNVRIVQALNLPLLVLDSSEAMQSLPALLTTLHSRGKSCYAIVDALLGTGLTRDIKGHIALLIDWANSAEWAAAVPRVAVDIPSGLNANTGIVQGVCFRADYTASYGWAQPGHLLEGGRELCGRLQVIDIGIPTAALEKVTVRQEAVTAPLAAHALARIRRPASSHKGSNGHLLVIAGSLGKTGAAILSVKGALRSGCGLVSLCCPQDLNPVYEASLVEAMTIPLAASSGYMGSESLALIEQHLPGKRAVVLGPGMGLKPATAELVLHLYNTAPLPLVLDADALTLLARHKGPMPPPPGPRIFTPHPGELARMLGVSVATVQGDRIGAATSACQIFDQSSGQCSFILKGAGTVIASSDGPIRINTSGNPGMATGGMGDVLSGMIGAFLGQGLDPQEAACAAVYLHGAAGDRLLQEMGVGYTASELADAVPHSMKAITKLFSTDSSLGWRACQFASPELENL